MILFTTVSFAFSRGSIEYSSSAAGSTFKYSKSNERPKKKSPRTNEPKSCCIFNSNQNSFSFPLWFVSNKDKNITFT